MKSLSMLRNAFLPILISSVLAISLASLASCNNVSSGDVIDDRRPKIITTVFAAYDFACQVGKENVDVTLLVPPGTETHSYEPTPQDIISLENCDLFIYAGGESDSWVEDLLASVSNPDMKIIKMVDCVKAADEDNSVLADPSVAEDEVVVDEHVWTSLRNAAIITQTIEDNLFVIDQSNMEAYARNTSAYCGALGELDNEIKDIVANGNRKLLIFGDRYPFRYFAQDYGLECKAAFPGCSTATEASAQTVAALVDIVREKGVPVVLYRELSNHKIADAIAQETGVATKEFHSCHNISKQEFDAGTTYVDLMKKNAETLKVALT